MDSDSDCEIVEEKIVRPFSQNPFCGVNKKLESSKLNINELASQNCELVPKLGNYVHTNGQKCGSDKKAVQDVCSLNCKKGKDHQLYFRQPYKIKQEINRPCSTKYVEHDQNLDEDSAGPPPCFTYLVMGNIGRNEPVNDLNNDKMNSDKNIRFHQNSIDSVTILRRESSVVNLSNSSASIPHKELPSRSVKLTGHNELVETDIVGSVNNENQPPLLSEVTDLNSSDTDFSDTNDNSDSHDLVKNLSRLKDITLVKKVSCVVNSCQKLDSSSESGEISSNHVCMTKVNSLTVPKPQEAEEKTSAVFTKTLLDGNTVKSIESSTVYFEHSQKDQKKIITSSELVPADNLHNESSTKLNSFDKTIDDVAKGLCGFKNADFMKNKSRDSNKVSVQGISSNQHKVSAKKSNKTRKQKVKNIKNKTLLVKAGKVMKKTDHKRKRNSSTVISLKNLIEVVTLSDDDDIFLKIPLRAKSLKKIVNRKDSNKKSVLPSKVVKKVTTERKSELKSDNLGKNALMTGSQQSFLKGKESDVKVDSLEIRSAIVNCPGPSNVSSEVSCSKSNNTSKDLIQPLSFSVLQAKHHIDNKNSGSSLINNFSDNQKVAYSRSISSSPGKYLGSPKGKSGSPGSPSKRYLNKFSPFRKSNKNKSPQQNSSQKVINQYFPKIPPRKNLFEASVDEDCSDKQIKRDDKLIPGIMELKSNTPSGIVSMKNGNVSRNDAIKLDLHQHASASVAIDKKSDSKVTLESSKIELDSEDVNDILRLAAEKYQEFEIANAKQGVSSNGNSNGHVNGDNFMVGEKQEASSVENKDLSNKKEGGQENGRDNSFYYHRALSDSVRNTMTYVYLAKEEYLFSNVERKILSDFQVLPEPAQYLYCRLLARKNTWIRKLSMKYPGLSRDLSKELDMLHKEGFVNLDHSLLDLQFILGLLNVAELKKLCKKFNLPLLGNKNQLIESLMKLTYQQVIQLGSSSQDISTIVRKNASELLGYCAILTEEPRNTFLKCMRIFTFAYNFGHQEELFRLIMDISVWQFPKYECKPVKVFYSRENYEEYEKALLLQSRMAALGDGKKTAEKTNEMIELLHEAKRNFVEIINNQKKMDVVQKLPDFMRRYTAGNVYARTISAYVETAFNKNNKKCAVEFYKCLLNQNIFVESKRGLWYVRLVLIFFHHLKNYDMVGEYLLRAQSDDKVNLVAKSALYNQVELILNRKNVPDRLKELLKDFNVEHVSLDNSQFKPITVLASSIPSANPGNKKIYVSKEGDNKLLCSVEEIALKEVKLNGYSKGLHDEGKLLREVLLSCFWDVIYGKPDYESENLSVFFCLHQENPADWQTSFFYDRRKLCIEERLQNMSKGGYDYILDLIEKCCNEYEGIKSVISWSFLTKEKLKLVKEFVRCLPVRFIVETSRHLLKNYRAFSSGFPDLTLWNPSEKKSIFVEVKGPNDSLSNTQKIWLQNIKNFGGDSTICFVEDPAGRSNRKLPGGPSGKKRKLQPMDDSQNL